MSETRRNTLRRVLLLAAALGVGAVGWFLLGDSESVVAEEGRERKVLARVEGRAITEEEVEEAAAASLREVERRRLQVMQQTLEQRVRELLVEVEAKKRQLSPEDLLERELARRAAEVPQEEVDALYRARAAQIRGPRDRVEDRIRQQLAAVAFYEELEMRHEVEVLLEPFRAEVATTGARPSAASSRGPLPSRASPR